MIGLLAAPYWSARPLWRSSLVRAAEYATRFEGARGSLWPLRSGFAE